jgi:hypothetical protein
VLQIHSLLAAAMAKSAFVASPVNQDTPHRFGCRGEEMRAVGEFRVFSADQPEPGFVDQGGGLESLTRGFIRHPAGRQFAQLVIDQGQELNRGVGITLLDGRQDTRDIAHGSTVIRFRAHR